ncbi:nucleoside triphosphate pyrophosphatase [Planomicrobium sp. CPCC 101110]|uniref:Maf family protein n=1 Tax=Planomicrobium sp. CPCC 101110 TaxID=2599619 RepID=UPI0011B62E1F|nr:Maf family protein [Planomicrobium sp. CPCC 101110]TWT26264.1 septum formation protein Maf [Planomicrobium sp. CPCC 101110]
MKFIANQPIVLASQSPRRQELLGSLGIDFTVVPSTKDEPDPKAFQTAMGYVLECAAQKAREVSKKHKDAVVIGSDTIVTLNGEVLLKPKSKEEAKGFLRKLSGGTHDVITAITVLHGGSELSFHELTQVTFYDLADEWIDAYTDTEDPYDKAGAYGIQTASALFVKKIDGDYNTVVGLPLASLAQKLSQAGYISLEKSRIGC